jgi:Gpi18-like mannosyltransferase
MQREAAATGDSRLAEAKLQAVPRLLAAHPLAAIVAAGIAVRLALTPLYAYLPDGLLDEGFWKHWMERIDQHGVLNIFRTSDTDYVGYHWLLWLMSMIYDVIGGPYTQTTPSLHIFVKMPSIIFDVILILVVYRATLMLTANDQSGVPASRLPLLATRLSPALVAAAVIAFHPAVLYDSAVWAQTDAAITAAMMGALLLAYSARPLGAGASIALGLAVKPHPVIAGPLLLLTLLRHGGWRAIALAAAAVLAVAAIVLGPWVLHGDTARIIDVYEKLFTPERFRLSELAWNGWWIADTAGDPRPGDAVFGVMSWLTWERLALTLSFAAAALAFAYAWRRPGLWALLIAAAYQAFAFYMLPVGSHERYVYPLLAFLLPAAVLDRRWALLYGAVSATFFLNLIVVAPPVKEFADRWVYSWFGAWVGAANVALFAGMTLALLLETLRRTEGARDRAHADA